MNNVKLVATDLDGTFLRNDKSVSPQNREALDRLGGQKIVRVAATGRNLNKVREVLDPDVPFDYIVFSSGAGIYDWQNKKHIFSQNIQAHTTTRLTNYLVTENHGFFVFKAVPDNHCLWFFKGNDYNDEFDRYFSFHRSFATEFPPEGLAGVEVCQFLLVVPGDALLFHSLKSEIETRFPEIGVIRSTSPLGTPFIWMELFHKTISKGSALAFICDRLGIHRDTTASLGNDYNDVDLLRFTRFSALVENSPGELKRSFATVPSNEDDGFAFFAGQHLSL